MPFGLSVRDVYYQFCRRKWKRSNRMTTEPGETSLWTDNCDRHIHPKLKAVGLEWVTVQVLRRSCSSIMGDNGIDPKVVADQLGHTVDVNLNVYTRVGFERQAEATNRLDLALQVN